jgi:hypothetical protein
MTPMGRIFAEGEWNADDADGTDFRGREMERGWGRWDGFPPEGEWNADDTNHDPKDQLP